MNKCDLTYLMGALEGDGYIYTGKSKGIVAVFTQKNREWLENIRKLIKNDSGNAWIFKQRDIFVLETKFKPLLEKKKIEKLTEKQKLAYVAGFFDAEGGIPLQPKKSKYLYIQFVQKNPAKLKLIREILENTGIKCGVIHQYDKKKSKCWRFFVRTQSHFRFIEKIKSKHPSKIKRLQEFRYRLLER